MVVDLPRRWRWAIVAGCGFAVVLAVLFVILARRLEAAPEPAIAVAQANGLEPPIEFAEPSADSADPDPDSGTRGVDEVQVCGGAWVKTQPDGSIDPDDLERATRLEPTREAILARLRASPSELGRATALALDSNDSDALARMAASTTDPQVYALAYKRCAAGKAGEGACQLLSAEQWARLDPGNASPWLFVLSAAKARNDAAGQEEALYRIAVAPRSDIGYLAMTGAVLDAAPDNDASLPGTSSMATQAAGIEASFALPGYQPLIAACRGQVLRDANRAQTCAAVADLLAERSTTLIDRMMGVAIGRQIGWPADRSERMRGEYMAYAASLAPASVDESDLGCGKIRKELGVLRHRAALGEAGALREWIAQSGKKPEDFISEERARQQQALQLRNAASAAASGAGQVVAR